MAKTTVKTAKSKLLTNLLEIQQYLIEDHPDKIVKKRVNSFTDFIFEPYEIYVEEWGGDNKVIFRPHTNLLSGICDMISTTNFFLKNHDGCYTGTGISFRKATKEEERQLLNHLPNTAKSNINVNNLKYPDVIHIETEEQHKVLKNSLDNGVSIDGYDKSYKYYLIDKGYARTREAYEGCDDYIIYEFDQIEGLNRRIK